MDFKESKKLAKEIIKGQGNYGEEVSYKKVLNDTQLQTIEKYLNWKLNDNLNWWKEWGVEGRVNVEVKNMIKDNDFYIIKYDSTNETPIYELQSDCDRYRFCCSIFFNPEVNEFYFNKEF